MFWGFIGGAFAGLVIGIIFGLVTFPMTNRGPITGINPCAFLIWMLGGGVLGMIIAALKGMNDDK